MIGHRLIRKITNTHTHTQDTRSTTLQISTFKSEMNIKGVFYQLGILETISSFSNKIIEFHEEYE